MHRGDRKRQKRHRQLSVEGVAAMLNDEDADLYNITDAAVQEDALAAAWNLTALAAEAIRQLAQATNRRPLEVLSDLEERGFGGLTEPASLLRRRGYQRTRAGTTPSPKCLMEYRGRR